MPRGESLGHLLHVLRALSVHLGHVLARYGGWGLLAINFLDSSFLAFPVINDLLLLHLAARHPNQAMVYALQSTAGSILGAFAMYGLSHRGSRLLRRNASPNRPSPARRWIERNDFVTVLVASLLPPPAPFKVVPILAGALQVNRARFGTALFLGRGVRFAFEAYIGMRYGAEAEAYLRRHLASFTLVLAALIIVGAALYRYFQQKATSPGPAN